MEDLPSHESDTQNRESEIPQLTILEQLGADAVDLIIQQLYKHIMADPLLKPFFANKSVEEIIEHQKLFFYTALGSPDVYKGRSLEEAHKQLPIEKEHMDLLVKHLKKSLEDYAVDTEMIESILATVSDLAARILRK